MYDAILLIRRKHVDINISYTVEDIPLHKRIGLLKLRDDVLRLHALGYRSPVFPAGGTCICKMTCALDEMKMIEVSPGLDIFLADQIHRPDQFHSFKVLAVQFRHHRLDLRSEERR